MIRDDAINSQISNPYNSKAAYSDIEFAEALSVELSRLDNLFSQHLASLRKRGRSILGDAIGGAVIEEGEAEGLLQSLYSSHTLPAKDQPASSEEWISPLKPLEHTRRLYELLPMERDILFLAMAVEIDSRYARLVAFLNDHVNMTRPTLGLAMTILLPDEGTIRNNLLERIINDGPLQRYNLLRLAGNEPLSNRPLIVPPHVWSRLLGIDIRPPFTMLPMKAVKLNELQLPQTTYQQALIAKSWAQQRSPGNILLMVSGDRESGRETLARSILCDLCSHAILPDSTAFNDGDTLATLEREARWHNAAIILKEPEKIPESQRQLLLEQLSTPIVYLGDSCSKDQLLHNTERDTLEIILYKRDHEDNLSLWQLMINAKISTSDIGLAALAARFPFGPGRINSAIQLAKTQAESQGRLEAQQADLESACLRLRHTQFGNLAEKLPCRYHPDDIVLPYQTRQELQLIISWAKHGQRIFASRDYGRKLRSSQGLACLFSGPPGTGKTMAAQVIAHQIDYELYRIDLSQVVNKYIGETEKNLAKVFDEAQRSRVVLFFDEADALFGRRSEVKDAHDRYANIETGYLLQRLENYDGLAILATNLHKNLDDAFLRRLQVTAEFPMPRAAERKAIWQRLLPPADECDNDLDLALLSERFDIAGGDIRNAIFTALLLAAEDNSCLLGMRHLVLGLWRELQKSGRIVDLVNFGEWREVIENNANRIAYNN